MISSIFYSPKNVETLKSVIQDKIQNDMGIQRLSLAKYQDGIEQTMHYVGKNVSQQVPDGISKEDYLLMMNKKVFQLISPVIKEDLKKSMTDLPVLEEKKIQHEIPIPDRNMRAMIPNATKRNQNTNRIQSEQQKKMMNDPMFDPILLKDYQHAPVIDYPTPTAVKIKEEQMGDRLSEIKMERENLQMMPTKVNFQDPVDDLNSEELNQKYNQLLQEYEKQTISMEGFESEQRERNIKMDHHFDEVMDEKKKYDAMPIYDVQDTLDHFGFNENMKERERLKKSFMTYEPKNENQVVREYNDLMMQASLPEKGNPLMNQKNGQGMEFSPFGNDRLTSVILPVKQKTFEKKYYVTIGSVYRNKKMYPDQNYFEVKFNPASNSYVVDRYVDEFGTVIFQGKNLVYGDDDNASIPITFDNVKQIRILNVTVPIINTYRGGRGPIVYNGPIALTGQTNFSQYDPIPTKSTGIPQNIFREPALYLYIPEIEHSYYATSNFGKKGYAKLNPDSGQNNGFISVYASTFCNLRPNKEDEFFKYDPVLKGKLDKFTMGLYDGKGKLYDFGIDKLYIENIARGEKRYSGYCGNEYFTTKITIKNKDPAYSYYCSKNSAFLENCDELNSHPVAPGDLLFFYQTLPQQEDYIYLEDYVKIKSIMNTTYQGISALKIDAFYEKDMMESGILVTKSYDIVFRNFIPGGNTNISRIYTNYSIVLGIQPYGMLGVQYVTLNILGFEGDSVIVEYNDKIANITDYKEIPKIAWAANNPQGINDSNAKSLFYNQGFHVIRVGNFTDITQLTTESVNFWEIEIDFPYDYLPSQYRNDGGKYDLTSNDIFFLQQKLQLVYDLEIITMVKDSTELISEIQGQGP